MARGRPIIGVDLIERLDGPRAMRRHVRIVLATIAGGLTITQACAALGVGRSRFHALRWRVLTGALDALRPRPRGRPRRVVAESSEVRQLRARIQELEVALRTTALRSEIALTMPHLLDRAARKKKAPSAAPRPRLVAAVSARTERPDARRLSERRTRHAVVACRRWARRVDVSTATIAEALGLSARTVREWDADARCWSPLDRRGRPARSVGAGEDHVMRTAILLGASSLAVAPLQRWCPAVSRRAVAAWLRQYRRDQRRGYRRLTWTQHGRVWAMDFSQPLVPVDGRYQYVLHVRDLASRYQLAALPVPRATSPAVCDLLRVLTAAHDAPLVLKVDNGSAFGSREVGAWAQTVGTHVLYSPPRYPRYNGSIEASIGAIATRAHHAAAAAGHPDYWTSDDVEVARAQANLTGPGAHGSRTPAQRWHASPPITATERRRFGAHYTAAIARQRGGTTRVQQRTAIVDTLRALGYVTMKRRTDLVHSLTNEKRQTLRA